MQAAKTIYPASFIKKCQATPEQLARVPLAKDIAKMNTVTSGVGIFALRPFARGEMIGQFLAVPETKIKQHTLQQSPHVHLHDPYFVGYFLHSCSPNVVLDMHQQHVYAIADIAEGSPLTMDYASTEDKLFRQFPCACMAPNCRRWISGRAERVNRKGKAYLQGLSANQPTQTEEEEFLRTR